MKIQAIVLAGGRGTRLAPITDTIPKPLVPVLDRPILDYVLAHLRRHGITRVAISISYLGEKIQEYYGDGSRIGMEISYLVEPEPMGTGGWTQLVNWEDLDDAFLVLNADNVFWIDLDRLVAAHQASGGIATMVGVEIPSREVAAAELLMPSDDRGRLEKYIDRSESAPLIAQNDTLFVSSGWYMMTPKVRDFVPRAPIVSLEVDIWPALTASRFGIGFYDAKEPWFDTGTHERIARIEHFLRENNIC